MIVFVVCTIGAAVGEDPWEVMAVFDSLMALEVMGRSTDVLFTIDDSFDYNG